jgi:hypothetical protein
MKRSMTLLLRIIVFATLTYWLGNALAVFVIRRTPDMPYWLDVTLRYLIKLTHAPIDDPEDIATLANLATFASGWLITACTLIVLYKYSSFWLRRLLAPQHLPRDRE